MNNLNQSIDSLLGKQVWFDRKDVKRLLALFGPAQIESDPFGYWHQGATEEESDFFKASDCGDVECESCISLYTEPRPTRTFEQWLDEPDPSFPGRNLTRRQTHSVRVQEDFRIGWNAASKPAPAHELSDAEIRDIADEFTSEYRHGGTTFDEFDSLGFARAILSLSNTKA